MSSKLTQIAPGDIEAESFRIIGSEIGEHSFDAATYTIVRRVIHATGDFAFKDNMRFSPEAVSHGIKMLKAGKDILTDVTMVASGISKVGLGKFGGKVHCGVAMPDVAEYAKEHNMTRSEAAIEKLLGSGSDFNNIGIIAVGNAPTALVKAIRMLAESDPDKAPLVIGIPVGFVNAAESKELLAEQSFHYITSLGRKGGSPVAAATVNALLRLCIDGSAS